MFCSHSLKIPFMRALVRRFYSPVATWVGPNPPSSSCIPSSRSHSRRCSLSRPKCAPPLPLLDFPVVGAVRPRPPPDPSFSAVSPGGVCCFPPSRSNSCTRVSAQKRNMNGFFPRRQGSFQHQSPIRVSSTGTLPRAHPKNPPLPLLLHGISSPFTSFPQCLKRFDPPPRR